MSIKCPHCKSNFDAFDVMDGRVQCPNCGKYTEVGEQDENPLRKYADAQPGEPEPESAAAPLESGSEAGSDTGTGAPSGKKNKYVKIKPGEVLGGFRIEEILGAGAMAVVYKATQLSLNRPVALKILPERFAKNRTFIERFDKESDALAALNHPNIINVVDRGNAGKTYFFAMEYVEGTSLREMMTSNQVGEEFFIRIVKQCCEGLKYAHSKGIIHRDIKPSNIMLNSQGIAKLADFGLAGILAEERQVKSRKRMVMGTRGYMPPEQSIDISKTGPRSDIYSLGAVMYEVLVGNVPETSPPPAPSTINKDLDPRIDKIILKCLKLDPEERYQSIEALLEDVEKYHAIITAVGEACPNCGAQNPVREKKCLKCGQDLSELFDFCPECKHENRLDVQVCFNCGSNLHELRERISIQIGKLQNQARELLKLHKFDEATRRLQAIRGVEGKRFEYPRQKAAEMVEEVGRKRQDYYQKRHNKAKQLAASGDPVQAVETLKKIPTDVIDCAAEIDQLNALMEQCKQKVQTADEAVKKYDVEKAKALLTEVENAWKGCPGFAEAKTALDTLVQSESMIDFQIQEADRLLGESNFIDARAALQFALDTTPDHPRVKAKMAEIDQRESRVAVEGYLTEGKTCFEQRRYEEAAFHWKSAVDLMPEGDPKKAALLKKVEDAKQKALGPDAVKPQTPKPQKPGKRAAPAAAATAGGAGPDIQVRSSSSRKWLVPALAVLAVLLLGGVGFALYTMAKDQEPSPPLAGPVNGKKTPETGNGSGSTSNGENGNNGNGNGNNGAPALGPAGPYREDFDAGEGGGAANWLVQRGEWRVVSSGRRSYRSLQPEALSRTEHKHFNLADAAARATVSIDYALENRRPMVALQIRQQGNRALELRLIRQKADTITAGLIALVDNKPVKQSEPAEIGFDLNRPYNISIDAVGPRAVAKVGEQALYLYELPPQLQSAGRVRLLSRNCTSSWDDIYLGPADPSQIPEEIPEPEVVQEKEPPEPEAVPLAQMPAQRVQRLQLGPPQFQVRLAFRVHADLWKSYLGTPATPKGSLQTRQHQETLTVLEAPLPADVDLQARCQIMNFGASSRGTHVGVLARFRDAKNYVMMGIQGVDKDHGVPFIKTVSNGKETVQTVSEPKIIIPLEQNIQLRLMLKGTSAFGLINNRPVLRVDNLDQLGLKSGKVGLAVDRMHVNWNSYTADFPQLPALNVPKRAEVKTEPGQVHVLKAMLDPITIKGLKATDGFLQVTFKLGEKTGGYPQFALHGRYNEEQESYYMSIDIPSRRGAESRVSLLGRLRVHGRLRSGNWAEPQKGPEIYHGDEVTLGLRIVAGAINGYVNGKHIISARDGRRTPVRQFAGEWGFRSYHMESTVTKILFQD